MATQVKVSGGDSIKKFLKKLVEDTENAHVDAGFTDPQFAKEAYQNEYGGVYKVDEEWREKAKRKGIKNPPLYWNITPRPFMHDTITKHSKEWSALLGKALVVTKYNVQQALGLLGTKMQADIQDTIKNNNYPRTASPFSDVKGNDKPLVDTGGMLQSVTFEVNK